VKVALERIASTLELDESAMRTMESKRSMPRIPFGALVETGLIQPGAWLTDSKRRWRARVRADASLELEGKAGSIHQIGASAQSAPSCNGWTFWHLDEGNDLILLDELRRRYILAQSG
jgi:modification methylase